MLLIILLEKLWGLLGLSVGSIKKGFVFMFIVFKVLLNFFFWEVILSLFVILIVFNKFIVEFNIKWVKLFIFLLNLFCSILFIMLVGFCRFFVVLSRLVWVNWGIIVM